MGVTSFYALTKRSEQFSLPNVHGAQGRVIAARRANLVGNSNIDREVPHPI